MVVIVGTSHTIQTADPQLMRFLEHLCQQFMVQAVAEEMNEEALAEQSCAASIPMQVASALKLPHGFCDPNRAQRRDLGIRQENDIRISAFPATMPESEVAVRVAESHAKRERYWLDQLCDLSTWPALFVCGADHVASFSQLLKQQGMAVQVAAEDWASNSTVERDAPQAARPSL
jgi:hypothetical protein